MFQLKVRSYGIGPSLPGLFIYFRERGKGEKERERNINVWLPFTCPPPKNCPSTQACALTENRICQPFGLQASTQSTEPHQPGPLFLNRALIRVFYAFILEVCFSSFKTNVFFNDPNPSMKE